jgi:protoporphyrinogen oxidase
VARRKQGGQGVYDGPVVVVGGGVCGLVTAHLLAEAGSKVVVVERQPTLGGLARSFVYEGFVFDIGPHRFHTANPNVHAWVHRILEDEATSFPRLSEVYFRGRYYHWPLKPQNLTQLPPSVAMKAFVDLAANQFRKHPNDNFEGYVLNQYGPTLYENFFKEYSIKFLGIHPRETHPDWAKVGLNRAIIDEKLEMHNLSQLAKTTLLQASKTEMDFVYPKGGLHRTWAIVAEKILALGGEIHVGESARLVGDGDRIGAVKVGNRTYEPSQVVWTAPITAALDHLDLPSVKLDYLGLLLYNVLVRGEARRPYQWCYFGQKDLVFNRISIPRYFSDATCPPGTHGLCVEVTCREGDARWRGAEGLTDWVIDGLKRVGALTSASDVQNVYIERIGDSYPIYHKQYPEELERARRELGRFGNLHLAGRTGLFWYNNMDHSIENAMQLTKRLLRDSGRADADEALLAQGRLPMAS